MFALFRDGSQISKAHSTKEAAMVEAFERGVVGQCGIRDFPGDRDRCGETFLLGDHEIREVNETEQIDMDSRGNMLYVKANEVGGRTYISDEIGGGVTVWDTCLVSMEMVELALKAEREATEKEKTWQT